MSGKKGIKILARVCLACLGILVLLLAIRQAAMIVVTGSLPKLAESDHFVFYAVDEKGLNTASILADRDAIYDRISSDLNYHSDQKIIYRQFPSMRLLHLSWGNPFEWPTDSVANSLKLEIRELSSLSADWNKYYNVKFSGLFSHELTHVLTGEINPDRDQSWLVEGLAMYEQLGSQGSIYFKSLLHEHVVNGDVPDPNRLTGRTLQNFINNHGYEYGYTVVMYVVQTYGKDKLAELARTQADSDTFLGIEAADFWAGWLNYLKENY